MLSRVAFGQLPDKPHTELRGPDGELRYEHCWTRDGFDGPFTISYHVQRPQAFVQAPDSRHVARAARSKPRDELSGNALRRRHFRTTQQALQGDAIDARVPLLFNADVVIAYRAPSESDHCYFSNADGDELLYVQEGGATLVSPFGRLDFGPGDYVFLPKGLCHRFELHAGTRQRWLSLEFSAELGPLAQFRNRAGQLRMDAPYSHRDFELPEFTGPVPCEIREVVVKRCGTLHSLHVGHSMLDVVGYDGCIYPWKFPILRFQPRVGSIHLPPTVHGTFAARGVLVCSFVPRPLDFGDGAVPCPYPHSSSDVDEVIFYSRGSFTSRSGVDQGSLTLHPRGVPHGPQPGRYEASIGGRFTDELAVMLDCASPLSVAAAAAALEDTDYDAGFSG